jgi:alanine racemase
LAGDLLSSPAIVLVHLERIRENFRQIREFSGGRAVIPVLKADAYGHGAVEVARALEPLGPDLLAVAYLAEARALRAAGIGHPLLVLGGLLGGDVAEARDLDARIVVSTHDQIQALAQHARHQSSADQKPLPVHVEVDTGMNRLGFRLSEMEPALHLLEEAKAIEIEGLMTHLASADSDELETRRQLDLFEEAIARAATLGVRPRYVHAANSAGLAFLRPSHTAVRPGLALYGVRPRPLAPALEVQPALEVRARIAMVKTIPPGATVSYGGRFRAPAALHLATLGLGYADGVPRTARMRETGYVSARGKRLPVAGEVCMDYLMADATNAPDLAVGELVTVLGPDPNAWDLATWAGTTAWQVLVGFGTGLTGERAQGGRRGVRVYSEAPPAPALDGQLTPVPPNPQ